jgi:peptidoglycan hydrolase-like protein with peptidoglycan-binding domain
MASHTLVEAYLAQLQKTLPYVPPISVQNLQGLHKARDYEGIVRLIRRTMNLEVRLVLGLVNSGGPPNAPAWIELPKDMKNMPYHGTEAFKEMKLRIFFRKSFLEESTYDQVALAVAHELSHIVLASIRHPLWEEEKAVDLTTMLLGFRLLYKSACFTEHISGDTITHRTLGYLNQNEVELANEILMRDEVVLGQDKLKVKEATSPIAQRKYPLPLIGAATLIVVAACTIPIYRALQLHQELLADQANLQEKIPIRYSDFPPPPRSTPQNIPSEIAVTNMDLLLIEGARTVQQRLARLGFYIGIPDGIWTPKSRRALCDFKSANGLGRDDSWDGSIQVRLFAQTAEKKVVASTRADQSNAARCVETYYPPPIGAASNPLNRADAVRLQTRLADLGFYIGQRDGVWGRASRNALRDFKLSNGLVSDDQWDADTERTLLISTEQAVRWIDKFFGKWADDVNDCEVAPIQVSSRDARSNTQVCEFEATPREEDGLRVEAVCTAGGVAARVSIKLTILDGKLTWSEKDGTRNFVRCGRG